MPEDENRRGGFLAFWTTLPGILTGLAALITAVVGAIGLWKTQSGDGNASPTTQTESVETSSTTMKASGFLASGRLSLLRNDPADLEQGVIGESPDADVSFGPETTPTLHGGGEAWLAPVETRPTKSACAAALNGRRDTYELVSKIKNKWTCVSTVEGNVAVVRVVSAPGVGSARLVLNYTVWR
jgi:hypothetical protein